MGREDVDMNQNVSCSIAPARTLLTIVKDFQEQTSVILRHVYSPNHDCSMDNSFLSKSKYQGNEINAESIKDLSLGLWLQGKDIRKYAHDKGEVSPR